MAVQDFDIRQGGQLLQEPALEHLGVVGVFFRQECAVAKAGVEVPLGRNVVTADARRRAETAEFGGVRPGKVGAGGVDLVEPRVQAEAVIRTETFKIVGRLDGRGVAARVVVAHMDAGLVDVGCPHKGRGVTLQHKDALARRAAFLRRIQPIQPRTEDDFIVGQFIFLLWGTHLQAHAAQ